MIEITDFQSLLEVARAEEDPQQFLFVFARTELPDEHDSRQAEEMESLEVGLMADLGFANPYAGDEY